jgi:spermidine synthase
MNLEATATGLTRVSAKQPGCDDITVAFEGVMRAHFTTAKTEVCLLDTKTYGEVLFMDGTVQSSQTDEGLYHEALVVPALCARPDDNIGDVLILGGGEGCVAREVLKWGARSITQYDHDEEFVRWARHGLVHWNKGAYVNERVKIHTESAEVALSSPEKYDVIFMDLFDPDSSSVDWFCKLLLGCVGKLRAGGVLAAYIGDAPRGPADVGVDIVLRIEEALGADARVLPYRFYIPSFYGEACFVFVSVDGAMPAVGDLRSGASAPQDPKDDQNAPQANQNAPQFIDEVNWVRACTWGFDPSPVFNKMSERYVSFLSDF